MQLLALAAQPAAAIRVLCAIRAPFWPVIVVGMISGWAHMFPFAVSSECGPLGSVSEKLDTGTSGSVANVVVVMPPLISVLPTRIVRTPEPSNSTSRSGNAAPPWDTRIAGPLSWPGSTGVVAVARPTVAPAGQREGSAE